MVLVDDGQQLRTGLVGPSVIGSWDGGRMTDTSGRCLKVAVFDKQVRATRVKGLCCHSGSC